MNETEAPFVPSLSEAMASRDAEVGGAKAAEGLRHRKADIDLDYEDTPKTRVFLSPQYPTGRYLARAGTVRKAANNNAPLGMESYVGRDGDVWVKFTSGVVSIYPDGPDAAYQLPWLEAHSGDPEAHSDYHKNLGGDPRKCQVPIGLCHESGPGVDAWAELKSGQVSTSRRPATISPELDVDAFLRGDHLRGGSLKTGEGARMKEAADNNEAAAHGRSRGQRNNT